MKYKVKTQASFLSSSSKFAKKMMMFDRLIGNPVVDQKNLIKKTVLKELEPGHEDEYLAQEDTMQNESNKLAGKTPVPAMNNMAFSA